MILRGGPTRRRLLGAGVGLTVSRGAAAGLSAPAGQVILTVEGAITQRNAGDRAAFDLAMLDALPQGQFSGMTPFQRETLHLSGPLLRAVLAAAGAAGALLEMHALNDYSALVPVSDAQNWSVILATRKDGVPLTVRERGPVWVMYPFDREASLRTNAYYARAVWQLERIVVV